MVTRIEMDAGSGGGELDERDDLILIAPEAGGLAAISRWLRSSATIPPDHRPPRIRIPEGCQLFATG